MSEQSFMKGLFHGVIDEDMVFPFPAMSCSRQLLKPYWHLRAN